MIDVKKVNETKEKILTVIQQAGPSFPTRISREAGISPLFIGALLSELVAEKRVVMSAMKVGSSPLYYAPGQEPLLENFTQFLNHKEREAISLLKEAKMMDDELQDPAIRVALRKLKDFAVPLTVRDGDVEKLYWRFFTTTDDEVRSRLEAQVPKEEVREVKAVKEVKNTFKEEVVEKIEEKKPRIKKDKKTDLFTSKVKDYLATKDIEIIEDIPSKTKEYNARVRIDTLFGKQEYLVLAKEKKKLTEDDLVLALHKAQSEKMPALILSPGDVDKTAKLYLESWKNLLKVEKL